MDKKIRRRDFLMHSGKAGLAGCAIFLCSKAIGSANGILIGEDVPDPGKLNYCGYTCPEDCEFKKATSTNDSELKKKCFEDWAIKERYGLEYDESIAFCHGCKTKDMPGGVVVTQCTVRKCTIEKGFDCCIECKELRTCDKDLWQRFPQFYDGVKKLQIKFWESQG